MNYKIVIGISTGGQRIAQIHINLEKTVEPRISTDEQRVTLTFPNTLLVVIHKCPRDAVVLASVEGLRVGRAVRALESSETGRI